MLRSLLTTVLLLPLVLAAQHGLIPAPVTITMEEDRCTLACPWVLEPEGADMATVEIVRAELTRLLPPSHMACLLPLRIRLERFTADTLLPDEWYTLHVDANQIHVSAPTDAGLFRGTRTLVQLLERYGPQGAIPFMRITDHPRFPWRGMHLDVVRHFWPVEFVKKYIDLLARYKMNTFHWHLTDDQGWRIEIRKRPLLTTVGGWRNGSQVGPYAALTYDTVRHAGFYTQDQIREVVAYAQARHIHVVPEIEMPGHALAALAAYPHAGCTGGPYAVERGWGVFADVFCAGNDSTFALLQDVLDEVTELFPSPIIHVGGDECPKERWKECPRCQARMRTEGLHDEHELQSYFIQRIGRYLNAKGRRIIGWDEIMEGGLAPNAAVMSWRGTEGGLAAARSGHDAVMCPVSHCYFDHYQGDPAHEPLAFGGYTPLQKVYAYEPIPTGLEPDRHKHILGAQGNMWAEYILTTDQVEYMALPRMLALAEVLWTPKEMRDEADFIRRLEDEFAQLDQLDVNASRSIYQVPVELRPGPTPGTMEMVAHGPSAHRPILFRKTSGTGHRSVSGKYTGPVTVAPGDARIEFQLADGDTAAFGAGPYPITGHQFHFNKATGRPVTLSMPPSAQYNMGGAFTLVDGIRAERRVNSAWLGWHDPGHAGTADPITITVDLGRVEKIERVALGIWHEPHSWIHAPRAVTVRSSKDGRTFTPHATIDRPADANGRTPYVTTKRGRARHVQVQIHGIGTIPEGQPGAGYPAWIFLDELEVH